MQNYRSDRIDDIAQVINFSGDLSHCMKADATQLEEFFGMVKGEEDKADLGSFIPRDLMPDLPTPILICLGVAIWIPTILINQIYSR